MQGNGIKPVKRLFSKWIVRKLLCCDCCKFRSLLLEEENNLAASRCCSAPSIMVRGGQRGSGDPVPWELTAAPCPAQQRLLFSSHDAGSGSMGAAQVNHKSRHELTTHPNVTRAKQRMEPRSDNAEESQWGGRPGAQTVSAGLCSSQQRRPSCHQLQRDLQCYPGKTQPGPRNTKFRLPCCGLSSHRSKENSITITSQLSPLHQ